MAYLVSLIFLLLPSYLLRFSVLGIPTTLLEVLIYIVFIIGLVEAKKMGFRKMSLKIVLPIILLIVSLIISTIISPDKKVALGEFKGFFLDPILVGWLIYQFIKEKDILKLFWALIASGAFVALHTIILKIIGQTTPDGRVIGIFGYSPNYVALYLAPTTVLLTAYGLQLTAKKKNYWRLIVCGLLLVLNLGAIYFTGSRGGILAVMAGVGIFAIANSWGWIKTRLSAKIIIGIVILVAIYTTWMLFKPDFSADLSSGRVVTSNNLRWQIWQTTLELGKNQPILGVGLGNFQSAFNELTKNRGNFPEYITPMAFTPHNIFLTFWLSTGILGLVAFIWILAVFYLQALEKIASKPAIVVLAVFSSTVIYGLIEASIWKNDLSIIFWTMWSLIWIQENANLKYQKSK